MLALNNGDYATAQQILQTLIAQNPTAYFRYPRLAATYAAEAGFSLTEVSQLNTGSSTSLYSQLSALLPTFNPNHPAPFKADLAKMGLARNLILSMPKVDRTGTNTFYSASAQTQLTLYQIAFSIMYLKQFVVLTKGKLDPNTLSTLTVQDAETIVQNISQSAQFAGEISGNPGVAKAVASIQQQIQSGNGADDRENVVSFLQSQYPSSGTQ